MIMDRIWQATLLLVSVAAIGAVLGAIAAWMKGRRRGR